VDGGRVCVEALLCDGGMVRCNVRLVVNNDKKSGKAVVLYLFIHLTRERAHIHAKAQICFLLFV
jgi:hypothetical protein